MLHSGKTSTTPHLGQLLPGGVPSATWEGGIACADVHGKVTDYWNTEITFTAVDPPAPGSAPVTVSNPGGFNSGTTVAPSAASASSRRR